ncbi:MAG: cytochrome C oxidase subunit IV family protein [Bacteroidetes bacterium]|nr:cytochrome C oxidase subunit IV family protein [Bacteroidota bacterium]MCH8245086.1 cytochrome C oxidase subunit IV family protein [Bacteroidota bacterium]
MAHAEHHITPKKTLIQVFVALITLTAITVFAAQMDLGPLNVPIALSIAIVKASLVVVIFMALKHDNRMNAVVFLVGAVFVVVFLVLTLFDTAYRGDLPNTVEGTIMEEQAEQDALRARDPGPTPVPPSQ